MRGYFAGNSKVKFGERLYGGAEPRILEIILTKGSKVLERRRERCHSALGNYVALLASHYGHAIFCVRTTDGSKKCGYFYDYWCNYGYNHYMHAGAGDNDDSYGLVVGTGTKPVEYEDYNLESKIPHGTGTGYLDYDAVVVEGPVEVNGKYAINYSRAFYNAADEPITVRETGIVFAVQSIGKVLLFRDVLDTPVTIDPGVTSTIRYVITVYV